LYTVAYYTRAKPCVMFDRRPTFIAFYCAGALLRGLLLVLVAVWLQV